jgi:hypothetical protein
MAYFAKAEDETVLQSVVHGKKMGKHFTNGFDLKPGITVGELSQIVMHKFTLRNSKLPLLLPSQPTPMCFWVFE